MNIEIITGFGINYKSIESCKDLIEAELAICFEERESSYSGIYFKSTFRNANLHLSNNYNRIEDYWSYPNSKELNFLLGISITTGKKVDRLETSEILSEALLRLGFVLVNTSKTNN